jgi:hypothetical protein
MFVTGPECPAGLWPNARFAFYHAKLTVAVGDFDVDDFALRGHKLRSSPHTALASRGLSNRFWRL